MPYKFPNVSFDWLGELPGIARTAGKELATKEALADLDVSTSEGLRSGAQKAFKAGNYELGLRLENAARERQALGHRISEDVQARQGMPGLVEALRGLGAPPAPAAEQPAEAPAPDYPWPTPGPGAQGPLPVPPMAQGAPPPPDMAASASPSETLLAAAEGQGPAPPALGPQLAQAGGTPPLAPAAPPPGAPAGEPAWLQGARAPVMPPKAVSRPAPGPVAPAAPQTQEAQRLFDVISRLPKNIPPGIVQGLMTRYRDALEREKEARKLTPDQTDLNVINAQRAQQGQRRYDLEEWKAIQAAKGDDAKEVRETFKEYRKEGKNSRDALNAIDAMEKIIDNPAFISGKGAALYGSVVSGLNTLSQLATQYGVTIPDWAKYSQARDDASRAQASLKLQEAFTALSNNLIYTRVGTLGNQISNADRQFIERAYPSLSTSGPGNKVLLKYMRAIAEVGAENAKDAAEYVRTAKAHQMNAADMEFFLEQKRESRKIFTDASGKRTKLGQELLDDLARLAPTVPVTPSTPARAPEGLPLGRRPAPVIPEPVLPGRVYRSPLDIGRP